MEKDQERSITPSYSSVFFFWIPLAATWLMMSVEGPLLAALIARMVDPKFNLAAYGVAYSLALVVEAPIIMIMTASTALVRDEATFKKLRNFTWALNLLITAGMLLLLLPTVFHLISVRMIGLPEDVAAIAYSAVVLLLPWPAAIGYRRFYQGILIRFRKTRWVAYGTVVRLVFMALTAFVLYFLQLVPGACVGAAALSAGVCAEAVASRLMAIPALRELKRQSDPQGPSTPSYKEVARFYYPLALTSLLSLGVHPLITFMVGHSKMAVESLAVLPVVVSLVFLFRSPGLAYQEVSITLIGDQLQHYRLLRNFAFLLMGFSSGGLALLAFTPLQEIWFRVISGLSPTLTELAGRALPITVLLPALSVLLSFQRAMVVNLRITRFVTWATMIEILGIGVTLTLGIYRFGWVGAIAACLALLLGRIAANTFLEIPIRAKLKASQTKPA